MKLPFVLRKRYEELELLTKDLESDVIEHEIAYKHIVDELSKLNDDYMELMGDMITLKEKLQDRECELKLNEGKTEELQNTLNETLEEKNILVDKNKELKFCLNEAKKECKNQLEIIKRTNIVKNLLFNLTTIKDSQNRILVEGKSVITHDKVSGNKVYDIARLLG